MSKDANKNLTSYINYKDVLRSLGSEAKDNLPSTCKCPICSGSMFIVTMPSGGEWTYCYNCRFAGDVLQLYMQVKGIDNVYSAIEHMVSNGVPVTTANAELVSTYLDDILPIRTKTMAMWRFAQRSIADLTPVKCEMLSTYQVYNGHPIHTADILGFLTKKDMAAFDHRTTAVSGTNALAVPFFDLPGRIRNFSYFSRKGEIARSEIQLEVGKNKRDTEGGLAFLDTVEPYQPVVYAIDNVLAGVMLKIKYSMQTGRKLPLVVWRSDTANAWSALRCDKLIMWTDRLTEANLRTAIDASRAGHDVHISCASVAAMDMPAAGLSAIIDASDVFSIIGAIQRDAKPVMETVKDYVKAHPFEAGLLSYLNIMTGEIAKLLDVCDEADSNVVRGWVNNVAKKTITVGPSEYYDAEDGIYLNRDKYGPIRISNIKLMSDQILHMTPSGLTYQTGKICINGKEAAFKGNIATMGNALVTWSSGVLKNNGITDTVEVDRKHTAQLYTICSLLYPAPEIIVSEVSGWDNDKWSFPRFTIKEGVEQHSIPDNTVVTPGINLKYGVLDRWAAANLVDGKYDDYWALIIGVLYNLLAPAMRWSAAGVCVEGDSYDKLPAVMWLQSLLNLDVAVCNNQWIKTSSKPQAHVGCKLPQLYDYRKDTTMWPEFSQHHNGIFVIPKVIMDMHSWYPGWIYVTAPNKSTTFDGELIIPSFLRWMHARGYDSPGLDTPMENMAALLHGWLMSLGCDTAILNRIEATRAKEAVTEARKYVGMLTCIMGQPTLYHHYNITIGKPSGSLIFNTARMLRTLRMIGYPMPPMAKIVTALQNDLAVHRVSTTEGLVLNPVWVKRHIQGLIGEAKSHGVDPLLLERLSELATGECLQAPTCQDSVESHASDTAPRS